jgi:hypothetical protein
VTVTHLASVRNHLGTEEPAESGPGSADEESKSAVHTVQLGRVRFG